MTAAELTLPKSAKTVRVRMFDTTTKMSLHTEFFVEPVHRGHETLNLTSVGFVIESETLNQRVVYDLGCKKEYWKAPPLLVERMKKILVGFSVDLDASEVLEQAGIDLQSVGMHDLSFLSSSFAKNRQIPSSGVTPTSIIQAT